MNLTVLLKYQVFEPIPVKGSVPCNPLKSQDKSCFRFFTFSCKLSSGVLRILRFTWALMVNFTGNTWIDLWPGKHVGYAALPVKFKFNQIGTWLEIYSLLVFHIIQTKCTIVEKLYWTALEGTLYTFNIRAAASEKEIISVVGQQLKTTVGLVFDLHFVWKLTRLQSVSSFIAGA